MQIMCVFWSWKMLEVIITSLRIVHCSRLYVSDCLAVGIKPKCGYMLLYFVICFHFYRRYIISLISRPTCYLKL